MNGVVRTKEDPDYKEMVKCAMCGEVAEVAGHGSRNWHQVGECKDKRVVRLRRAYANSIATAVGTSCKDLGQAEIAGRLWMLDDQGVVLDLDAEDQLREVMGELDGREEREMADLVDLLRVRETHWREQRRFAYKGMLGGAWERMLTNWVIDPTVAARTRKKLFDKGMDFGTKLVKIFSQQITVLYF